MSPQFGGNLVDESSAMMTQGCFLSLRASGDKCQRSKSFLQRRKCAFFLTSCPCHVCQPLHFEAGNLGEIKIGPEYVHFFARVKCKLQKDVKKNKANNYWGSLQWGRSFECHWTGWVFHLQISFDASRLDEGAATSKIDHWSEDKRWNIVRLFIANVSLQRKIAMQ